MAAFDPLRKFGSEFSMPGVDPIQTPATNRIHSNSLVKAAYCRAHQKRMLLVLAQQAPNPTNEGNDKEG